MPATEYLRWAALLEKEPNDRQPEHWYAAQVAFELWQLPYRVWGQAPPTDVTIDAFMLKFGTKEEIEERSAKADEERARYDAEVAKVALMGFFGIDPETGQSRKFQTKLPPGMQGQVPGPAAPDAPPAAVPLPPPGFVPQLTRRKVNGR